jgi:hypothetical protein
VVDAVVTRPMRLVTMAGAGSNINDQIWRLTASL